MQGRAHAMAGAESVQPMLKPAPGTAGETLLTIIVSPQVSDVAELTALIHQAVPGQSALPCAGATEAIDRARSAHQFGWTAGLFIFDYRGRAVSDLLEQLRRVRAALAQAELIVVVDGRDDAVFSACLQATQAPQRLTFLVAPLYQQEVVSAIRMVAERFRAMNQSKTALEGSNQAISGLQTQLREMQTRLEIAMHAAQHDGLTGILNRAGFIEELSGRLTRSHQKQTLLLIDLDRFKSVNDTLGHHAGDELVRKICTAVAAIVPAGGVMARLGGDEFGIVLERASDRGIADACALILRVCAQSRRISGHEVQISASIGVAHQSEGETEVALMRHADLALYAAKREGRNRYRVYDTAIKNAATHRLSIENGLERALRSSQFRMAYQPIVTAQAGKIQGFEALVRWDSPEHGPISPADFVPIAEETGLILDLGDWITRQAFKDCRRWGGPYVSVNLSARQFLRQNVADRILQYAADADLAPERIQIELTETAIIDDVERAASNLEILRGAGMRVALDDFGTGYSSLVYLNQFAIDCIKIDKSFVDNVTRDRQSAIIVASVTRLASSLGMSVVAEGVETAEQRQVLIAAGCGYLQGYHFGRPKNARDTAALLAATAEEG